MLVVHRVLQGVYPLQGVDHRKTTLIHEFLKDLKEPSLFVSGEDIAVQEFLTSCSVEKPSDA